MHKLRIIVRDPFGLEVYFSHETLKIGDHIAFLLVMLQPCGSLGSRYEVACIRVCGLFEPYCGEGSLLRF